MLAGPAAAQQQQRTVEVRTSLRMLHAKFDHQYIIRIVTQRTLLIISTVPWAAAVVAL